MARQLNKRVKYPLHPAIYCHAIARKYEADLPPAAPLRKLIPLTHVVFL